jgi:hypothetical protein
LLKADLSRFYHTLYTHSISWALHTKAVAKARQFDRTLYGNLIDEAVRNTQDKQTLGIPVGPVTSDLISELLGASLDEELSNLRPGLKGLRYVDDYYLYFANRSEAEAALADLHSVANHFAVEINPLKTRISELPEPIQPGWRTACGRLSLGPEVKETIFWRSSVRPSRALRNILGIMFSNMPSSIAPVLQFHMRIGLSMNHC